jgi:glycosyltransferase involved in cell wall biosynthesis
LIVTRHVLFSLSRLHRVTLGRAARIIAVSQAVASQLQADAIASAEKISVVLNGIDIAKFQQAHLNFNRARFLARWGVPENSLLVGTVGELTPLKGQVEFLQAAAQLLAQNPNAYFFVVGVDHSRANSNHGHLQQLIEKLQLAERVRLVGWFEGLEELYSALDVFVSASHTESFGLAIAEAMATGMAVVATETEGARELIETGETGTLVPIGNVDKLAEAVAALLRDKNERERLGMAAQRHAVASFSVERMVAETEEIYLAEISKD